jgi:hypothetical protein
MCSYYRSGCQLFFPSGRARYNADNASKALLEQFIQFCQFKSLIDATVKHAIDHAVLQEVSALDGAITEHSCSRLLLAIS